MEVGPEAQPAPAFKSKQEFLDSIVKNAPFGQGGPPPSLHERLEKPKKK